MKKVYSTHEIAKILLNGPDIKILTPGTNDNLNAIIPISEMVIEYECNGGPVGMFTTLQLAEKEQPVGAVAKSDPFPVMIFYGTPFFEEWIVPIPHRIEEEKS